jgi:hypothetical protein
MLSTLLYFENASLRNNSEVVTSISCLPKKALNRIISANPDLGGQKGPTKIGKSLEISCLKVVDVLF